MEELAVCACWIHASEGICEKCGKTPYEARLEALLLAQEILCWSGLPDARSLTYRLKFDIVDDCSLRREQGLLEYDARSVANRTQLYATPTAPESLVGWEQERAYRAYRAEQESGRD